MVKSLNKPLILILLISAILRLTQLGYSNFYGDETKAIYFHKKATPIEHFLNQRKGPGQFLVAWAIEKSTNSYNELYMRLPSAILGVGSCFILYLLVKELFDKETAYIATALFSLNGFYIAFSRTLQYQSYYVFFSLLGLYLIAKYMQEENPKNLFYSALCYGIAFLFHYDTLFFLIPAVALVLLSAKMTAINIKGYILKFVVPLGIIVCSYYLPYVILGAFRSNTLPYLLGRVSGSNLRPSSTLYTVNLYNPLYLSLLYMPLSLLALLRIKEKNVLTIFLWFTPPFILFQIIFNNPGTHIHNYILPLIILCAVGMSKVLSSSVAKVFLGTLFFITLYVQSIVFIPALNEGYPWKETQILGFSIPKLRQDIQVFVYGLPYYRNWDQIASFLEPYDTGFPFHTNDNDTIAQFYLRKFKKFDGRQTMFFIDINDNQMDNDDIAIRYLDEEAYYPAKDFYNEKQLTATVYLRHRRNRF